MRSDLVKILVCPDCKGALKLYTIKEKERIIGNTKRLEVWEGILLCEKCGRWYPIIQGIPWLYPKELRRKDVENTFIKKYQDEEITKKIFSKLQKN